MKKIPIQRKDLGAMYSRIGGEAALRRILADFYSRLADDVIVGFFFDGKDVAHISDMQARFLLRAWGATESYSGKPPAQAHKELAPILRGHFDRRLRVLEETLRAHGIGEEDIRRWVEFENAFREGIEGK